MSLFGIAEKVGLFNVWRNRALTKYALNNMSKKWMWLQLWF